MLRISQLSPVVDLCHPGGREAAVRLADIPDGRLFLILCTPAGVNMARRVAPVIVSGSIKMETLAA